MDRRSIWYDEIDFYEDMRKNDFFPFSFPLPVTLTFDL